MTAKPTIVAIANRHSKDYGRLGVIDWTVSLGPDNFIVELIGPEKKSHFLTRSQLYFPQDERGYNQPCFH